MTIVIFIWSIYIPPSSFSALIVFETPQQAVSLICFLIEETQFKTWLRNPWTHGLWFWVHWMRETVDRGVWCNIPRGFSTSQHGVPHLFHYFIPLMSLECVPRRNTRHVFKCSSMMYWWNRGYCNFIFKLPNISC